MKQEVEEEKKETIDMKKSLALKMSSDQEKKLVNHVVRMRKMKWPWWSKDARSKSKLLSHSKREKGM